MRRRAMIFALAALGTAALLGAASSRADPTTVSMQPHADITAPATTQCGSTYCAVVNYSVDATGGAGPPYTFTCNLPSGLFTVGSHQISCLATDTHGNSSPNTALFTITVTPYGAPDTTPPVFSNVPADINASTASSSGMTITYSGPNAVDAVDGSEPVSCDHASGATFPVGTTTVTCTSHDSHNNSASVTFHVTVTSTATGGGASSGGSGGSSGGGSSGGGSSGGGSSGGGSSGSSYSPDVTGCTTSTCMANQISFLQLVGCSCDFGSFNSNKTTYTASGNSSIAPTITVETGNQTNDVQIGLTANGAAVGAASTVTSGQQSGIYVTSQAITLRAGENVIAISARDPLHALSTTTYTFTFTYTPPASSSGGSDSGGSSGAGGSSGSGGSGATSGGTDAGSGGSATATQPLVVSTPHVSTPVTGSPQLSFSLKLAAPSAVTVVVRGPGGKVLYSRSTKGKPGVMKFAPAIPAALVRTSAALTVEVVVVSHGKKQTKKLSLRA